MPRNILSEDQMHPAVRDKISNLNRDIVDEVLTAIDQSKVVVVGMKQNPVPKKARKALDAAGIRHEYLEYGSYLLGTWRRRNALKMWTGWPTFPMIWVEGVFIGGCAELEPLLAAGELDHLK